MGRFPALETFVEEASKFLQGAEKRVNTLSDTIDAIGPGGTPTERLLVNSIGLWLDGLSFWMGMMPQRKSLPLMIKGILGTAAAQNLPLDVSIEPPSGLIAPAVTAISRIGGNDVLAVAVGPAFGPGRRTITMTVTIPANPVAGTYSGVIHHLQTPLASVVVYVY